MLAEMLRGPGAIIKVPKKNPASETLGRGWSSVPLPSIGALEPRNQRRSVGGGIIHVAQHSPHAVRVFA